MAHILKLLCSLTLIAALIEPSHALAQDSAQVKNPACKPLARCVESAKGSSTDASDGTAANPQARAQKKHIKRKPSKSGEPTPKTKRARPGQKAPGSATSNPSGAKKLANSECPKPYGPFTPTYCREGIAATDTNTPTPRARGVPAAGSVESGPNSIPSTPANRSDKALSGGNDANLLSKEELFGVPRAESTDSNEPRRLEWRGFVQNETAYTYADPAHWSRSVVRTQLSAQGAENAFKWKATARVDVDPIYYGTEFYPQAVRKDQRIDFFLRETFIDTSVGDLELRLGKQNIVWGEMVGLFFADVVSARDQRDFILPDFEIIRIPQWALRAEYFGEKSHAEIIWLPYPDIDNIGKPGAEFYPIPALASQGLSQQFGDEVRPEHGLKDSNFGARVSTLRSGWDLSAFYYRSTDVNPTFYRDVTLSPTPALIFTPRHDRIWQAGGTLGKDLGSVVVKAETVYASGRNFNVTRLTEPTGVVPQDTLDYALGFDFTLPKETRLNLQYFERVFFNHDRDLLQDRRESGVSLLLSGKIGASLEPELLIIQSVNRNDRLMSPKLGWIPEQNWRVTFGVDVFTGPVTGFFGRFNDRDRAYVELRYDF